MRTNIINTISFEGSPLLKQFIRANNIKGAFVHKEGERHWQIFEGDPDTQQGFLAGEYSRKRDAIKIRDKINELVKGAI